MRVLLHTGKGKHLFATEPADGRQGICEAALPCVAIPTASLPPTGAARGVPFVRCLAERHCSPRDRIPCLAVLFAKPVQTKSRHKKFGLVCGESAFSHHGVRWLPGSLARRHVAICPMRSWAEERGQIILFTQRNKNAKKQHLSPCHPFRTQPRDSLAAATAARAHRHWHRPPWCRPGAKLATHLRRS